MRVLFVSRSLPKNLRTDVSGMFQRLAMFIEAIGSVADLDMLFYTHPDIDVSADAVMELQRTLSDHWKANIHLSVCTRSQSSARTSRWKLYGAQAANFFKQPGYRETSGAEQVAAFEACLIRHPDVIFAQGLDSMCPVLLTRKPLPPVMFDLNDIEHVALIRGVHVDWPLKDKFVQYSRLPALLWGERRAIRRAHTTFVCSDADQRYLAQRWLLPGIATVPNTVREAKLLSVTPEPTLLFVGTYRYKPNVDAAMFLIQEVWPLVHRAMPQARLNIAGISSELIPCFNSEIPGVAFTGFVDDLEGLYASARVVCAPILSGGGTRVKIIEAAAHARAIVATTLGAEGLSLRDDQELLLRDDAGAFADACLELLRNASLCERLGRSALAEVRKHYLRETVVQAIRDRFAHPAQRGLSAQSATS